MKTPNVSTIVFLTRPFLSSTNLSKDSLVIIAPLKFNPHIFLSEATLNCCPKKKVFAEDQLKANPLVIFSFFCCCCWILCFKKGNDDVELVHILVFVLLAH